MMRHRWLLAVLVMSACHAPTPVGIGIVLSDEGIAGAELAAFEINQSGGINGHPLALRIMSAGRSTAARPSIVAAESLANDPATMAVVGHANSSASLAASQIYNARHLVQIAPTSSAPLLSRAGPFTFRLVASDIHQAQFLANVIAAGGARPRVAVFFVNDDYGHALEHELRARLGDQGVPIVYGAPYTEREGFADAFSVARAVASTHPAILVWLGRGPALLELLPALRRTMPSLRVLASDGVDNVATRSNPDSAFIGVQYVSYLQLDAERAPISALRARLKARSATPLSVETALSYDAVMLLATAAREAGTDRVAIRDYVASLGNRRATYTGATGPIAFSADGEPQPSYFLAEVGALGPRSVVAKTPP
jgi:branched-chain amino acid transport system substrate-binding protein